MTSPQRPHLSHLRAPRRATGPAVVAVATALLLAACGDATQDADAPMAGHTMTSGSTATGTASTTAASPGSTSTAPTGSPSSTAPAADSTGTPAPGPHNAADVEFAAGMVPHHQQAVVMADMAVRHGGTDDFITLAKGIKAAQQPEIEQMSGWLVGWGEGVPDASSHAGHTGMGMMSQKELDDLDAMVGSGFEGMWLTMMVKHHEGALDMARDELAKGQNPAAKKLAQSIVTSQTAEIATMKKMADARAS